MRLAKFLAHSGVASRRAAEGMIAAGRVAVGGTAVEDPALEVDETSQVTVDGGPIAIERREVFVLNKPAGVVATASDTHGRPTVVAMVASDLRLYPVGRLDADTTGLLLLTNDGDLAARLTHPRYGVEKSYRATIAPKVVTERSLRALRTGVELGDGVTGPAAVRQPMPGILEITIAEGRKRQVRRMLEALGHRVIALERYAFGPLRLAASGGHGGPLAPGAHRRLRAAEVERLRKAGSRPLGESTA